AFAPPALRRDSPKPWRRRFPVRRGCPDRYGLLYYFINTSQAPGTESRAPGPGVESREPRLPVLPLSEASRQEGDGGHHDDGGHAADDHRRHGTEPLRGEARLHRAHWFEHEMKSALTAATRPRSASGV